MFTLKKIEFKKIKLKKTITEYIITCVARLKVVRQGRFAPDLFRKYHQNKRCFENNIQN